MLHRETTGDIGGVLTDAKQAAVDKDSDGLTTAPRRPPGRSALHCFCFLSKYKYVNVHV